MGGRVPGGAGRVVCVSVPGSPAARDAPVLTQGFPRPLLSPRHHLPRPWPAEPALLVLRVSLRRGGGDPSRCRPTPALPAARGQVSSAGRRRGCSSGRRRGPAPLMFNRILSQPTARRSRNLRRMSAPWTAKEFFLFEFSYLLP